MRLSTAVHSSGSVSKHAPSISKRLTLFKVEANREETFWLDVVIEAEADAFLTAMQERLADACASRPVPTRSWITPVPVWRVKLRGCQRHKMSAGAKAARGAESPRSVVSVSLNR